MRSLIAGIILFSLTLSPAWAEQPIREIDFRNFTYPLSGNLLGHNGLQWLSTAPNPSLRHRSIHLVNGKALTEVSRFVMDGKAYPQYEGFTFESVSYADLTGDGREEAIVTLRYYTGGTQTTNYVYIYSVAHNAPKLLAYCHTGDRAYGGLYGVNGNHGVLTVELLDPEKQHGDCCSTGIVRTRYRWSQGRFRQVGNPVRLALPPPMEVPH